MMAVAVSGTSVVAKFLYESIAKSILSIGVNWFFKKINIWRYKKNLANILQETADKFKEKFPENHAKLGTPFYESQFVLEVLLKKYFFDIRDENQIKKAIQREKGVLSPNEEQLEYFIKILESKLKSHKKLKSKFIENESKLEVFQISSMLTDFENDISLQLQELIQEAKDKKVITLDLLLFQFQLSKVGWLKERYLPQLHKKGKIEEGIEELLFSEKYRNREISRFEEDLALLNDTIEKIGKYLELTHNPELNEDLASIKENLKSFYEQVYYIKQQVILKNDSFSCPEIAEVKLWEVSLKLEEIPLRNTLKTLRQELIRLLQSTHGIHLSEYIVEVPSNYAPHNTIFLAPAGSGKTHALANAVEKRLENDLPAIIVDAQSVQPSSWKSILINGIGLADTWEQSEIFQSLNKLGESSKDKKILIAVDGLDEVGDYPSWKIRVDELKIFLERYPYIRFAIACRNYVPKVNPLEFEITDYGIGNRMMGIYDHFVASEEELHSLYFKEYNINLIDAPWISDTIKTPLELRLFCEEYRNQKVAPTEKISLPDLISKKIDRVEQQIFNEIDASWIKDDHVPKMILTEVALIFFSKNRHGFIDRKLLIKEIMDGKVGQMINRQTLAKTLDFFSKYELLLKLVQKSNNLLDENNYIFRVPYQSIFELLIAHVLVDQITQKRNTTIPPQIVRENRILEFAAIILLSDYQILVGEDGLWVKELSIDRLRIYQIVALSNIPFEELKNYKGWVAEKFRESNIQRNLMMEYLIIPGARIPDYPINGMFLHEILSKVDSVYERDLLWSGPGNYSERYETSRVARHLLPYYSYESINVPNWEFELKEEDDFNGLPLIFAWSLTSIENVYREHCRKELCHWAFMRPEEFTQLLDLVFHIADPQMKEDLASVISGVGFLCKKHHARILRLLSEWVIQNIFTVDGLMEMRSPIIRQTCRNIVDRAYAFGEATEEKIAQVRPPFDLPFVVLNLDSDGLKVDENGVTPITQDLAWYVIQKSFTPFLPHTAADKQHIQDFYLKHNESSKIKVSGNRDFAFCAALAYIKSLGWTDGGEYYSFTQASHGSKSRTATFAEKYTWCAVHHIMGYLSDYLPVEADSSEKNFEFLTDYYKLLSIPNPVHLMFNKYRNSISRSWVLPTDLTPNVDFEDNLKKLEEWIHYGDLPDYLSWLKIDNHFLPQKIADANKEWETLYSYTCLAGPNKVLRTSIAANICFIEIENFEKLLSIIKKQYQHRLDFPTENASIPDTSTYVSPIDVSSMDWIQDIEAEATFYDIEGEKFHVHYGLSKVTYDSISEGETHYKIPSKLSRNLLGIKYGNGLAFRDENDEIIAFDNSMGETYKDVQQMILVNSQLLNSELTKQNLKKFWMVSIFKDVGLDARKELDFYQRHRHLWLIWEDENGLQSMEVLNDDYKK